MRDPSDAILAAVAVATLVALVVLAAWATLVAVVEARADRRQAWLDSHRAPEPDDGTPCLVFDRAANAYVREAA